MADEPVVAPAAPSPAPAPEKAAETPLASIPTDPAAYAEWRQTGKLPGDKTDEPPKKKEAPASSKAPSGDDSAEPSESSAASEAGGKGRSNAETRIRQLVSERDSYKARLEALETGKKDAPAASSAAPVKDDKAAPSPATEELKRPVKPDQDSFDTWDAYEQAREQYYEDLADWKAAQRIEADRQRQRQEAQSKEMEGKLAEAKQRYGEEAEPRIVETAKTVFDDQQVPLAVKTALGRSSVLVDALYVMGSDAKEFAEFMRLAKQDPLEALRKWFTIEGLVKEELGGKGAAATPERGPDGKFLPEKPARKAAPAPPVELNGNSSPPGDQSERAAAAGNFAAFREERNLKDFRRHKGQG